MPQANATPRAAATTATSISRRFSSPTSDAASVSRANFRAATEIAPAKCRTTSAPPATDPPDKNASSSIFSSFASGSARTVAVNMPRAVCPSKVTSSFSSQRKRRPPARTWTFPSIRRAISESCTITEILRPAHKKGNKPVNATTLFSRATVAEGSTHHSSAAEGLSELFQASQHRPRRIGR